MMKKLASMPYAQAHVDIHEFADAGAIDLVSYRTRVAHITPDGWLSIFGLISRTTRKHIDAFMKEYANSSYQVAKDLYEHDIKMNIHTGEIRPMVAA